MTDANRQRKKKKAALAPRVRTPRLNALCDVIKLILRHHYEGVKVLFGEVQFPDIEEIYYMLGGGGGGYREKVDGGKPIIPEQQRIIERVDRVTSVIREVGGVAHIVKRFQHVRTIRPDIYEFLRDMSLVMTRGSLGIETVSAKDMADRYHMSVSNLMRTRDKTIRRIAADILHTS